MDRVTWNEDRGRWVHPCGHVAMSKRGKPVRRDQQPSATCRACADIARKAEAAEDAARREAAMEAAGNHEVTIACPKCLACRNEIVAIGSDYDRYQICGTCRMAAEVAAWAPTAKRAIQAELRRLGFACTRRARKSSGSTYYSHRDHGRVRLSDHELPATPEREHNHDRGWRCADYEIVLDSVQDVADIIKDLREWIAE